MLVAYPVVASVVLMAGFATFTPSAIAQDPSGIDLELGVIAPTNTPRPTIEVPVEVPVDVPVSEATFVIELSGLEPFSFVEIFANSTPVLIASGFADANGKFSVEAKLPPNIPPGEHSISAANTLSDGTKVVTTIVSFAVTQFGTLAEAGASNGGSDGTTSGAGSGQRTDSQSTATIESKSLAGSAANGYLGPDPFNLGGVFYLGNLTARADYERVGIYSPDARLEFAVRNVSKDRAPAFAHLWVTGPLGNTIVDVPRYQIVAIEPGETRLIIATLRNIGQWGVYTAHMVFTPPEETNGGEPIQFQRDSSFFAFSITLSIIFGFVILVVAVFLWGRRYRGWRLDTMFRRQVGNSSNQSETKND